MLKPAKDNQIMEELKYGSSTKSQIKDAITGAINSISSTINSKIDDIVGEMHDDGTLTKMSEKWYGGEDLTVQQ